jgi:hypothetical protein
MRRLVSILAIALLAAACLPVSAGAVFGFNHFDVEFTNEDGTTATQAGSHPFAMTTSFGTNTVQDEGFTIVEEQLRDIFVRQIPGFVADSTAYPRCTTLEFLLKECPLETVVGITASSLSEPGRWAVSALHTLPPPPGVLVRFGFRVAESANIVVDAGLTQEPPYVPIAASRNTPQVVSVLANKIQLWGDPASSAHDEVRGDCGDYIVKFPTLDIPAFDFESQGESCPVEPRTRPFLTLPTTCEEPLKTSFEALAWDGSEDSGESVTHDEEGDPQPFTGCGKLAFKPQVGTQPTSKAASSPTGLEVSLQVADEGLTSLNGLAQSHIRRVELALPEGMTANPSVAEGLEVCTEPQLEAEKLSTPPSAGCPEASKIGAIEVQSPLVAEPVRGALFQAAPFANLADDSLLAFYIVLRNSNLGLMIKQTVKVEPDPETGQLVGITEEIPQVPFSSFRLRFREGGRSPLVSPPLCGTYETRAEITPWSGTPPVTATSTFEVISGPNEAPCPGGGTPPFDPGFTAGSVNNAAGSFSPFQMRLTRRDGDQDLTRFDATLPPGVVAKLAGVSRCSDAQIASAKARTGREELASPSCPANSKIGRLMAGAGVGSQLTYVPGSIYLAAPFGGEPISAVAIVPAVAGPFDVGTVVYRQALRIDPRTAEVTADGALSDPLPHILAGIPVVVRDVQVHVDRQSFTLNPTSCAKEATEAEIWGGGLNPFSPKDDSPVSRSSRYQAASCASLGFKPRLNLKLKGGTSRGDHPALRGVFRPREGDANLSDLVLRLPRSAFLDQGHIRTICTRVQFAADNCPPGAIYGHARAFTPLLEQPLEGPVYLRSSDNELPDFVAHLRGLIDVEVSARIDSIRGGIRATFSDLPDAPVSKVVVNMQGARKGLIINSTNLCAAKHRAQGALQGQNGKRAQIRPLVRAGCGRRPR